MTTADQILLACLVVLAASSFLLISRWAFSGATEVEICSGDRAIGRYPLNQDRVIEVSGPLGTTLVQIKDGRARVQSSPCPNKMCMSMGDFGGEGGILVCVPNEVVVRLGKERPDGLDAVSR